MARRYIASANNSAKATRVGWGPFLNNHAVRKGYNDVMTGAGWSSAYADSVTYEWGRLIACEVRGIEGSAAPVFIPAMQRVTKEWQERMRHCTSFLELVRQHHTRKEFAA